MSTLVTPSVETRRLVSITQAEALAIGELLASVWPKPNKGPRERAAQIVAFGEGYDGPEQFEPLSHLVQDKGRVIAHAVTFCRVVETAQGETPVLALAMVAADPTRRGEGLGLAITRSAFARVDDGPFACSLFQTSFAVQPFYERVGCKRVENRIVNSLDTENPTARPFWDDVVMRYPGDAPWPEGDIDLRGLGY